VSSITFVAQEIAMPIYEYQCESCSHRLEKLQKMSDAPLSDCPECGQSTLRKLVSAAAFRLKGGGWYETDFKTGSKKNVSGTGSGSSSSASDSGSSNSTSSSASTESSSSSSSSKAAAE